jgi:NADPH:quinone reductase-like Zn-dependent oxidoreductase
MKAFIINNYGKKNKGEIIQVAKPEINTNDVLVKIHAAGLNVLDLKIRNGEFKLLLPYKTPLRLGHDVAGTIIKVGADVKQFKVGDEIYARVRDNRIGTLAEEISIHEDDIAIKPKRLTMEEAASLPLVGLTVWQILIEKVKLKKGQKIFIQAGSGGVGSFAIQFAKYLGATVATSTSSANIDFVKSLGADIVIDYKNEDFETILHDYDLVLNSQNIDILDKSLNILKPGGTVISISGPPTSKLAEELNASWFVKQVLNLLSYKIRKKAKKLNINYDFYLMKANGKQLKEIALLIDSNTINPVIDKIFPLKETNEALAYLEKGHAKGKVVIKI